MHQPESRTHYDHWHWLHAEPSAFAEMPPRQNLKSEHFCFFMLRIFFARQRHW